VNLLLLFVILSSKGISSEKKKGKEL